MLLFHFNVHFVEGPNPLIHHKPCNYEITYRILNCLKCLQRYSLVFSVLAHVSLVWVLIQRTELLLMGLQNHWYFHVQMGLFGIWLVVL